MGFHLTRAIDTKRLVHRRSIVNAKDVPRGFLAVYVGEKTEMKRFVIPVSLLNQTSFRELLNQSEEEFGYDHPMGGLTIRCAEEMFLDLVSSLNGL